MKCTNEHNDDDNNKNNKNQNKKFQKKSKAIHEAKSAGPSMMMTYLLKLFAKQHKKNKFQKTDQKPESHKKSMHAIKIAKKNKQWKAIRYYFGSFNSL